MRASSLPFRRCIRIRSRLQKPHILVLIGSGNHNTDNTRALRRVVEIGDGWVPAFLSPAQMREQLALLQEMCAEAGRDFSRLDITLIVPAISFGLSERPSFFGEHEAKPKNARELIAEYEEAGVTRLIVGLDDMTDERAFERIEKAARGLGL